MPTPIPARLVEFILLGPQDDRRQLQDSPILGDVWVEFGKFPAKSVDLLVSPYLHEHAGALAAAIQDDLDNLDETDDDAGYDCDVAYVQALVAARLTLSRLLRFVIPKTKWWIDGWSRTDGPSRGEQKSSGPEHHPVIDLILSEGELESALNATVTAARHWHEQNDLADDGNEISLQEVSGTERFVSLAALLCWAGVHEQKANTIPPTLSPVDAQIQYVLDNVTAKEAAKELRSVTEAMLRDADKNQGNRHVLVHMICLNRSATPALGKSVQAVKADAAQNLFKVDCSNVGWAILDSGIDGRHKAFNSTDGKCRIKESFDFQHFRRIVSMSNSNRTVRAKNVGRLLATTGLLNPPSEQQAHEDLERLAADARNKAPIHWDLVEKFVRIKPETPPPSPHGTHVAGILGANKDAATMSGPADDDIRDGMCPDIRLYDFRVLGPGLKDTEFAIIAALQFIRYKNEWGSLKEIQGANLSLSIPHDVRNFACGRTPICDECENLVESGVVVVAAAGNHGHKNFQTLEGSFAGYTAFSITDPGNAESVITVGATHRYWPHTYGVSFFSSRGPTGDGRLKPDLVAPGERIRAPLVGDVHGRGTWGDQDGTSMAAPHVSGAAAMLMARYTELIGQPRRIKQILCDNATDLGRERTFQGRGMLDVLRAFQSL